MLAAPLIPYIDLPELVLLKPGALWAGFPPEPFSIKPFGTLVAIGVYVGAYLAVRQGKRLGIHERSLTSFIFWVVAGGFIGGHMLDTIFYHPDVLESDPLSLIKLWEGLSSFGGFTGALFGALAWKLRYRTRLMPYVDVVASAFPIAWVFGRSGCTVAHDHPGLHSNVWFAVNYPGGARFDLGLYEMLLTVPLAVAFLWLRRKPRPWGFYAGVMSVVYAPTRFALDSLRVRDMKIADARYAGLTPAQWACFGLLALGSILLWRALDSAGTEAALLPPAPAFETSEAPQDKPA